jgi:hypothetical protein
LAASYYQSHVGPVPWGAARAWAAGTLEISFNVTVPSSGSYEPAYDLWANKKT